MSDKILKVLPELIDAGVISDETAQRIRVHFLSRKKSSGNIIITVFSIMGALLVGLGIILIIAHNWDNIPKPVKVSMAFAPLLIGQGLCGYALLRKSGNIVWKESAAVFLFCAVGASISLVSQVYNIEGTLSGFLFTWMLLCLPLIYAMNSSAVSLLYIAGITWYAAQLSYFQYPTETAWYYWLLLLLVIPHLYFLFKKGMTENFALMHAWLITISLSIALGTIADNAGRYMALAYMSLFGIFYLAGNYYTTTGNKFFQNPFKVAGSLGTISMLMIASFRWFWNELYDDHLPDEWYSPEFGAAVILTVAGAVILYTSNRNKKDPYRNPNEYSFLFFAAVYFIGFPAPWLATVAVNLVVLVLGIFWLRTGAAQNNLGILNYGLLIIIVLATCRFFDVNMSFVMRGLLFVAVGALFFASNMITLKRRKQSTLN